MRRGEVITGADAPYRKEDLRGKTVDELRATLLQAAEDYTQAVAENNGEAHKTQRAVEAKTWLHIVGRALIEVRKQQVRDEIAAARAAKRKATKPRAPGHSASLGLRRSVAMRG
jgi:predicted N-formylglutamate amidohydrolase